MPPARRSATKKTATRASKATSGVRARAASTSAATRREVEQSIARFEKRLDDANDALKTLGGHLGSGAKGSYREMTATLTALRREAAKTNKQALKDFDKLRAALTHKASTASRTNSRSKASSSASKASSGSSRATTTKRSSAKRSTAKRSTTKRSTAKRSTGSRSTGTRERKSS
jgi:hypothetical protein